MAEFNGTLSNTELAHYPLLAIFGVSYGDVK